ncbi:MAG: hypothetical protein LAT77_08255 [Aliidiomarina sp.]|uniref:hypothetical protein n=1 Tax=Aliidiomarina sp. TaxID=1872439 RepID=UPI0025B98379|nr:hypothetical protein [Aliidiomarina sp.]MCH8501884.1 hypothetical protein [Aliidiomarina sp.]
MNENSRQNGVSTTTTKRRPFALKLVAAIFLVFGLFGLVDKGQQFVATGVLTIDFNLFIELILIPVGLGILFFQRILYFLAKVILVLFVFFNVVLMVNAVTDSGADFVVFYQTKAVTLLILGSALMVKVWMFIVLSRYRELYFG